MILVDYYIMSQPMKDNFWTDQYKKIQTDEKEGGEKENDKRKVNEKLGCIQNYTYEQMVE